MEQLLRFNLYKLGNIFCVKYGFKHSSQRKWPSAHSVPLALSSNKSMHIWQTYSMARIGLQSKSWVPWTMQERYLINASLPSYRIMITQLEKIEERIRNHHQFQALFPEQEQHHSTSACWDVVGINIGTWWSDWWRTPSNDCREWVRSTFREPENTKCFRFRT